MIIQGETYPVQQAVVFLWSFQQPFRWRKEIQRLKLPKNPELPSELAEAQRGDWSSLDAET